jgi:hypothetical protein
MAQKSKRPSMLSVKMANITHCPRFDGMLHSKVLAGLWLRIDWLWQEPLPQSLTVLKEWGLI